MLSKAKKLADTRTLLEAESEEEQARKIADFESELESMPEKFSELSPEQKKRALEYFLRCDIAPCKNPPPRKFLEWLSDGLVRKEPELA